MNFEEQKKEFAKFMEQERQKMREEHSIFMKKMCIRLFYILFFGGIGIYLCKLWEAYAMRFL